MATTLNITSFSHFSVNKNSVSNFDAVAYAYLYPEFEYWLYDKNTNTINAAAALAIKNSSPTFHPYKKLGLTNYNLAAFDWMSYWYKYRQNILSNTFTTSVYRYADPTYTFTYDGFTFANTNGFLARYLANTQLERLCIIHWIKIGYDAGFTTDNPIQGGGNSSQAVVRLNMDEYFTQASVNPLDMAPTVSILPANTNSTWTTESTAVIANFTERPYKPIVEYRFADPVTMSSTFTVTSPATITVGSGVVLNTTSSPISVSGGTWIGAGSLLINGGGANSVTMSQPTFTNNFIHTPSTSVSTVFNAIPTHSAGLVVSGPVTWIGSHTTFTGTSSVVLGSGIVRGAVTISNTLNVSNTLSVTGSSVRPTNMVFTSASSFSCLANSTTISGVTTQPTSVGVSLAKGSVKALTTTNPFDVEVSTDTMIHRGCVDNIISGPGVLAAAQLSGGTVFVAADAASDPDGSLLITFSETELAVATSQLTVYDRLALVIVNKTSAKWLKFNTLTPQTVTSVPNLTVAPSQLVRLTIMKTDTSKWAVFNDCMYNATASGLNGTSLSILRPMSTETLTVGTLNCSNTTTLSRTNVATLGVTGSATIGDLQLNGLTAVVTTTTLSATNNTYECANLILRSLPTISLGANVSIGYNSANLAMVAADMVAYTFLVNNYTGPTTWTLPTGSSLTAALGASNNWVLEFAITNTQQGDFLTIASSDPKTIIVGSRVVYGGATAKCSVWYERERKCYCFNLIG